MRGKVVERPLAHLISCQKKLALASIPYGKARAAREMVQTFAAPSLPRRKEDIAVRKLGGARKSGAPCEDLAGYRAVHRQPSSHVREPKAADGRNRSSGKKTGEDSGPSRKDRRHVGQDGSIRPIDA